MSLKLSQKRELRESWGAVNDYENRSWQRYARSLDLGDVFQQMYA